MPEGGILEISAIENKQDGTVTISVHDSGIGMAPEVLAKLFQPLFTTKARGIGLGLVVVKNLTQANGGRVEVQSELGNGRPLPLFCRYSRRPSGAVDMNVITANDLSRARMDLEHPTTLYAANEHRIYWLGNTDETASAAMLI